MQTFSEMPYGYRWMTEDEIEQYNEASESEHSGWMSPDYIGLVTTCLNPQGQPVVQWDCMIEFGMDHDHDPVECERILADMNPEFDVHEHYDGYGNKEYY